MKRNWFNLISGVLMAICVSAGILLAPNQVRALQDALTPSGIFITVTYTDPMNVRGGPGTFFDIIGQIFPGDVLPALGISPGREWIQVSYPQGPGGLGWVYAPYVSISGGELQVVEPPPTPAPLITSTYDPTLAAAFNTEPTATRKPTYTPPPPLTVPQFTEENRAQTPRSSSGIFILVFGALGIIGFLASFYFRK